MTKDVVIVGAGALGREIRDFYLDICNSDDQMATYNLKGFIDDNPDALEGYDLEQKVFSKISNYTPKQNELFVLAIGNPTVRKKVFSSLKENGAQFLTLIHPTAYVSSSAKIGEGVIVSPFSSVSSDVIVGDGVCLNFYANIGHDAVIGDFSVMCVHSNVNGFCQLGDCVFLGGHAVVLPSVTVGENAKIAAGSVAMRRVKSGMTVMGVPAEKFM